MHRTVDHNCNKKGFTVAELMVVVAILTILAVVSIPVFTTALRNQKKKHVEELELAAKVAAVTAFYAGYDSKGNAVDISQTGWCTFLYDAENGAVYVSNTSPGVSAFESDYSNKIDGYGVSVPQEKDYSDEVILVSFDGRYYKYPKYYDAPNLSKGTFEEPVLKLEWYQADSLIK